MKLVPPAQYAQASRFAAGGGEPVEIALQIAGAFEGAAQQIVQVNERGEAPTASRVTVVRDGLLDDSIQAERLDVALRRGAAGAWTITDVKRAWRCRRGELVDRFQSSPCP